MCVVYRTIDNDSVTTFVLNRNIDLQLTVELVMSILLNPLYEVYRDHQLRHVMISRSLVDMDKCNRHNLTDRGLKSNEQPMMTIICRLSLLTLPAS